MGELLNQLQAEHRLDPQTSFRFVHEAALEELLVQNRHQAAQIENLQTVSLQFHEAIKMLDEDNKQLQEENAQQKKAISKLVEAIQTLCEEPLPDFLVSSGLAPAIARSLPSG